MKLRENGGSKSDPNATKIAVASLSAMVAETTTFPIDLTKTRLQLHRASHPTNAFRVASEIVARQGLLGLYNGLSPAILRHLFYTPIRIVGYEHLRSFFSAEHGGSLSLPGKALVGGVSGVMAQVVASPADLVKVRMQGIEPRYSGPIDALTKIVRSEGFGGHCGKGFCPHGPGSVPGSLCSGSPTRSSADSLDCLRSNL